MIRIFFYFHLEYTGPSGRNYLFCKGVIVQAIARHFPREKEQKRRAQIKNVATGANQWR